MIIIPIMIVIKTILHGGKNCQRSTYSIELYIKINIILIIKLVLDSYLLQINS